MIRADEMSLRELLAAQATEKSVRLKNKLASHLSRRMSEMARTPEGRAELITLMDDPTVASRLAVARRVLRFSPARAVPVIEELARDRSNVGMVATDLLQRFQRGLWNPAEGEPIPLTGENLDHALSVHSLIMNGGLFHAWGANRENFWTAERVFRQIGRKDISQMFSTADGLFGNAGALDAGGELIDEWAISREEAMTEQYYDLPDPQDSIEATEAIDE